MKNNRFTKGVEGLIDPISVGTLHFLQNFNDMLPDEAQKKLVKNSSKKNPTMGFIVDPYCTFLCYEITDLDYFQSMLHDNYELVKTKIFEEHEEKYYLIIGSFSARTSAFFGNRIETYAIAENKETGLMSWVILDYDTNTISYDDKNGLTKPNASKCIVTTDFNANVIVDVKGQENELIYNCNIAKGVNKKLYDRLWIEGNLSVSHSRKLANNGEAFSLKFEPGEMNKALLIDGEDLELIKNTWYEGHIESSPSVVACFAYAQHFTSDAPGFVSSLKNEEELVNEVESTNFDEIKVYSIEGFQKMILLVPTILFIIIIILVVLLILK